MSTIPTRDARHWLEAELVRLKFNGQTWSNGRPWGDLIVPHDGLVIHEPLIIPKNCNLIGPRTQIFDRASFIVSDDFTGGNTGHRWAITWEDSASQGNFSQQAHNISLDCRERADGIRVTGDQGSRYVSILVEYAAETNILFHGVTHGATAENIWVKGAHEKENIRGNGIVMRNCSSVTLTGTSIHRCAAGLVKTSCSNCHDIGTDFEKVDTPWVWTNAVNCDSASHHMLHTAGDGLMGVFSSCEQSVIRGTLRKCASASTYVLVDGNLVEACNQSNKNDPKPFRVGVWA